MIPILFLVTFISLAFACLYFWLSLWKRSWRSAGDILPTQQSWQPLIPLRERITSPIGLMDVTIMFVFWLMGMLVSATLAAIWLGIEPGEPLASGSSTAIAWLALATGLGQLISTAMGILLIRTRYRQWSIFGLTAKHFSRDVVTGMIAFVMVVPIVLLLQQALTSLVKYEHTILDMLQKDTSVLMIASTWFSAVLVAPICEEIFFRGILQSWLQRLGRCRSATLEQTINGGWGTVGLAREINSIEPGDGSSTGNIGLIRTVTADSAAKWMPILISAGIFGLAHISQGPAPISLFVFGLALGYLYRQTGSIVPCIVLHMGLNGFTMFWFTLQLLFPEADVGPVPIDPS